MKKFLVFIFISLLGSEIFAGGFDDLGNSARASALGGAFIAVSDAPYCLFYNPSAIYKLKNLSLSTSYTNLYPGIQDDNLNYFSLSGVIPLDIVGEFGVGGTFLNTSLWKEQTLNATYARELFEDFAIGGSFKLLHWSAEAAPGESALSYTGFTFDVGALYTFKNLISESELSLGMVAQNLTQPSIANNGSSDAKLPLRLGFGLAFYSLAYNYLLTMDLMKENDIVLFKGGTEFSALKADLFSVTTEFFVRLGYNRIISSDFSEQSAINGGFGINVDMLKIDYGYVFPMEISNLGGSHRISLTYNF